MLVGANIFSIFFSFFFSIFFQLFAAGTEPPDMVFLFLPKRVGVFKIFKAVYFSPFNHIKTNKKRSIEI